MRMEIFVEELWRKEGSVNKYLRVRHLHLKGYNITRNPGNSKRILHGFVRT
jgi:hypothetical protein